MGKSQLFYDRHQIGTTLIGMPESLQSAGATVVVGLDRQFAIPETLSPNFESRILGLVAFYNASWTQRTFNRELFILNKRLRRLRYEYGSAWLCWVNSEDETTETTANESAGNDVEIEVVSAATLNLTIGDYVLVFPPDSLSPESIEDQAQVLLVTAVGAGSFTVETLEADLPSGSTVYRIWVGWREAVFVRSDTGQPPEQSADTFRFVTTWEFVAPKNPVISGTE